MSVDVEYEEFLVPDRLRPFIRRFLKTSLSTDDEFTIPARPTGYAYLGWVVSGQATAIANEVSFSLAEGGLHLSGQLSTFDASYTLKGPAIHLLAECTGTGAHRLSKMEMYELANKVLDIGKLGQSVDSSAAFIDWVDNLAEHALAPTERVEMAVSRIENALGNIKIVDLCKELNITERTLHRQFTQQVGISPKAFAVIQRVLFALKDLTENPSKDVSQIALEAGFHDQSHLSNVFKQYMRTTPAKVHLTDDGVLKTIVAKV